MSEETGKLSLEENFTRLEELIERIISMGKAKNQSNKGETE